MYLQAFKTVRRMARKNQGGIVYSTGNAASPRSGGGRPSVDPTDEDLRVHVDRLKGNKLVTRITGFAGNENDLKNLAKHLKSKCGVGGNAKQGIVIIQGDHRDKIIDLLKEKGYKAKKSGG